MVAPARRPRKPGLGNITGKRKPGGGIGTGRGGGRNKQLPVGPGKPGRPPRKPGGPGGISTGRPGRGGSLGGVQRDPQRPTRPGRGGISAGRGKVAKPRRRRTMY